MSGRMFDWIMSQVDLPSEPLPGNTFVELANDHRMLIEHHYGVKSYDTNCIQIKTSYGQLGIRGCDLKLASMSKQQLVVIGRIDQISLCRGD